PSTPPTTSPTSAFRPVTRVPFQMIASDCEKRSPMLSGLGSTNGLMAKTTTASCQSSSTSTPKTIGATIRRVRLIASPGPALVRVAVGEVGEPHEREQLLRSRLARRPADPVQLERQLDVAGDGAPGQQAGLLERDAVGLVDARLASRRAEHADRARGGLVEVG